MHSAISKYVIQHLQYTIECKRLYPSEEEGKVSNELGVLFLPPGKPISILQLYKCFPIRQGEPVHRVLINLGSKPKPQ